MIRIRRISLDWQIGLIGLSALVGLMIAYQWHAALFQFLIVVLSIGLYLIMANMPDVIRVSGKPRAILAAVMVVLPAGIALAFLLTNDWSRWNGKVPVLDPILHILAGWRASAAGLSLNPTVIGDSLAALLPLQAFALRHTRRWLSIPLIGLTLVGLVLSQTRGAWLALIITVGMWALWKAITARLPDERRARRYWIAAVTAGGVVVIGVLVFTPLGEVLLGFGGDRRAIWHNSVDLVGDYPFTGVGLAGFEMVYSTYALLIHVGHTVHAHNLWLDMWLNQGIIGVLALAGMVLNAVWPKPSSPWRIASLLALSVILLHTLVDDPYNGYGRAALPIIFIPLGLLARSGAEIPAESTTRRPAFQPAFIVWGGAALLLIVSLVTPAGRAAIEANLGALTQTRAELAVYSWPQISLQDILRQPGQIDLSAAEAHYRAALAIDPLNATANRRLGQIELARQQFAAACEHLATALQAAPQQRATRQLAGECKAFDGQVEEAAKLWQTIDVSQSQLNIRLWWYEEYLQDQAHASQLQAVMKILSRE
jgi:O-antigen ligase